ncbi:MAG: zf-HC2 domain-containing protein [Terriglobia bacterium]|jgi:anti-sigma factor RsiW
MNPEVHERACHLIDAWHVEGISATEREWLEAHLAECPACQARARANERALQVLRSNNVIVDPALVSITQARVRWRARELRENQARLRALWISCGLSWLLGTLTAPLLWQAIAWLGRRFEISQAIWITMFVICWIAPATVVGALVAWKHSHASTMGNDPEAWGR